MWRIQQSNSKLYRKVVIPAHLAEKLFSFISKEPSNSRIRQVGLTLLRLADYRRASKMCKFGTGLAGSNPLLLYLTLNN